MRTAVVFLSVLALTGCVGSDHPVTPAPSPTSTPLFASEEEALKAAEAAYQRFNEVADAILHEGGADPDRLKAVATGPLLKENLDDFADMKTKGLRSTGAILRRDFVLQSIPADAEAAVVIYVCEDVSQLGLVNGSGASVVNPSRPTSQLMEVSFRATAEGSLLPSNKSALRDNC